MKLIRKIKEVDKIYNFYIWAYSHKDINFLVKALNETLSNDDKDRDKIHDFLMVKYFPEECDEELLKDPKIVLSLILLNVIKKIKDIINFIFDLEFLAYLVVFMYCFTMSYFIFVLSKLALNSIN